MNNNMGDDLKNFKLTVGTKNVIQIANLAYDFVIKTKGGTVIEGTAAIGNPLAVTPSNDIESFSLILEKRHVQTIHIVKK